METVSYENVVADNTAAANEVVNIPDDIAREYLNLVSGGNIHDILTRLPMYTFTSLRIVKKMFGGSGLFSVSGSFTDDKGKVYNIEKLIGEGGNGFACLVKEITTNQEYVVKFIEEVSIIDSFIETFIQCICHKTLCGSQKYKNDPRKFSHIPRVYFYGRTNNNFTLIGMEKIEKTFFEHVIEKIHSSIEEITYITLLCMYQVINTLILLEDTIQFNHRDLKTNNIMLNVLPSINSSGFGTFQTYFIDFGFARVTYNGSDIFPNSDIFKETNRDIPQRDILFLIFNLIHSIGCGVKTYDGFHCHNLDERVYQYFSNILTRILPNYKTTGQSVNSNYEGFELDGDPKMWRVYNNLNVLQQNRDIVMEIRNFIIEYLKTSSKNIIMNDGIDSPYFFGRSKNYKKYVKQK